MKLISQSKNPLVQLIFRRAIEIGIKSQKELATRCNVSESIVSRLSKGKSASAENIYSLLTNLDLLKVEKIGIGRSGDKAPKDEVDKELFGLQKEMTQAYKALAEHKDRIRELENALAAMRLRHGADRRRDDPPELNASELRRPIETGNAGDRQ